MRIFAALALALLLGCRTSGDTTEAPAPPKTAARPAPTTRAPAPSSDVTIEGDGKGGYKVKGGTKMKGSAHACKAYKSCCSAKDLSLFCGLLEASEKSCEGALKQVKQYAKEAHVRPPAGCE